MAEMGADVLNVGGVSLETRRIGGDPARPTLVLLHEGLGSVSLWRDFPDQLAAVTGHPVLAFSRAGYGRSDPVDLPRPLDYMQREGRDVLPGLLDAAGLDRVVLVGHSDGASIALVHAGSSAGTRVEKVVVMAPHTFVEPICLTSIRAAREAYLNSDLRDRLQRHHGANTDCAFWGWNDSWLAPDFVHWDIRGFLPAVGVPVLVIQGQDDEYGTILQVDAIRGAVPGGAATLLLPDCGHSPHRDQPGAVLAAIGAFLR
ncbi:MAG: alpha/beta hydrolase [Alphaproteobacteria bacterium]|nr:alpha/beta hydrolase [Alphaproteobacteria bacterium]